MKYLQISTVMSYGSIGRIMRQNYDEKKLQGWDCLIAYGRGESVDGYNSVRIGTDLDVKLHGLETRLLDRHGYASKRATKKFIEEMEEYQPDVIHLHNLHGYYINFELLFDWIKQYPKRKILWTLHDCWSFTGHCSYFIAVDCEQWKKRCLYCVQRNRYPQSYFIDNCKQNFERKKNAFTGVEDMTLITPSQWLADLVKQSFFKEYPIEVQYNEVDKNVFKPTSSNFRKKYGIEYKKMILGVANVWEERKGLNDFIQLADLLDDSYVIVLVGLTEKQIKKMPKKIIGITRTNNAKELAGIYTTADIFVNPTYEDNYPTVNLEAQACGTPCFTYNTGGSVESVPTENVAEQGDIYQICKMIQQYIRRYD